MNIKNKIFISLSILGSLVFSTSASADHSWGAYHWKATTTPLYLELGDNLTTSWDPFLVTVSADWSVSSVLETVVTTGRASRYKSPNRDCGPNVGRVEVCNKTYGNNGWLGIAQIWVNRGHISKGVTKMNDTYFNTAKYNTPAWKQFVVCQEVGHTFGLNHQDENFNNPNLGSCMDYTNDPSTNQHPNTHDFEQLLTIYNHFESLVAPLSLPNKNKENGGGEWGKVVAKSGDGRGSKYEKDLGNGNKVITHVIWAD